MPKREDEHWLKKQDNRRWCYKHNLPYQAGFDGCQKCLYERQAMEHSASNAETPALYECPDCKRMSLMWNTQILLYECINNTCRKMYAQSEVEIIPANEPKKISTQDQTKKVASGWLSRLRSKKT